MKGGALGCRWEDTRTCKFALMIMTRAVVSMAATTPVPASPVPRGSSVKLCHATCQSIPRHHNLLKQNQQFCSCLIILSTNERGFAPDRSACPYVAQLMVQYKQNSAGSMAGWIMQV